jgi:hypothetical protein
MGILNRSTASARRAAHQVPEATPPAAQWLWLTEGEAPSAIAVKLVECLAFALVAGLLLSGMR